MEALQKKITSNASAIQSDASAGCKRAKQVITLHRMCVARCEAGAVGLLSAAFDDWVQGKSPTQQGEQ